MPEVPPFDELNEWQERDAEPWLQEAIDEFNVSWETAWQMQAEEFRPVDDWEHVRIDAWQPDDFEVTVTYRDGTEQTLSYGGDYVSAWDMYDYGAAHEGVEDERGDFYSDEN